MKKILLFIFLFLFIPIVKAEDLAPNAKSAIMIEASTGKVLFEKNSDEKLAPASMTKMMSLLIIMEEIEKGTLKWNEIVTASINASSMGGSQIFLETGEKMTVEDLIKGMAIASGNDATVAMAERVAGTETSFVKLMNEKAKKLGLKNTNFVNSTGLDIDNHYSSARDMSIIARELVKHQKILDFSGTYEDYLRKDSKNPFWLVNTNRMVKFYQGVDGLKTGFTSKAGYCLTATAKKDGMRLITVVMNEEDTTKRTSDTAKLLDYGFNMYKVDNIVSSDNVLGKVKVNLGKKLKADVISKEEITILSKKSDKERNITYDVKVNEISAPIKKGDVIGKIDIIEDNNIIKTVDATVNEDIDKASFITILLRNIVSVFTGNIL